MIDTTQPLSPGWWMARLSNKLLRRQPRLHLLDCYLRGDPPLADAGVANATEIYRAFQRKARSNFAELIVEAARERMSVTGFRTAVENEDIGDDTAWGIWKQNALDIQSTQVHKHMLGLGDGYVIVGLDENNAPLITAEDPRECITEHDPARPQKVIAALKLFHDNVNDYDLAYLYLPGIVYTAGRKRRAVIGANGIANTAVSFSASGWDWVDSQLESIDLSLLDNDDPEFATQFAGTAGSPLPGNAADIVPVIPFSNLDHMSEFERHIDLLDRINHTILQRMVITTHQAFRQRAFLGDLPETDLAGNPIDYEKALRSDPGAVWNLPTGAQMWESGQVDLTGILSSISDDIEHLSSVTRTPMYYMTPGDTNQSAEGASLSREGLVFKTEDRISRANIGWAQVMYLAFLFTEDTERANLGTLDPIWAPVERNSLATMAAAAAQAITSLPVEMIQEVIWQFSPEQTARAKTYRMNQLLVAAQAAAMAALKAPAPTPELPNADT